MRIKKNKKTFQKLNLVPILDAVFIFIFFLLMSAQFIDIYEIGSDVPSIKTVSNEDKSKIPPLNLIIEINQTNIQLKTGIDEIILEKFTKDKLGEHIYIKIHQSLIALKKQYPKESTIIFRPEKNVNYKELVKIMDIVRNKQGQSPDSTENGQAQMPLFNQIVYET